MKLGARDEKIDTLHLLFDLQEHLFRNHYCPMLPSPPPAQHWLLSQLLVSLQGSMSGNEPGPNLIANWILSGHE